MTNHFEVLKVTDESGGNSLRRACSNQLRTISDTLLNNPDEVDQVLKVQQQIVEAYRTLSREELRVPYVSHNREELRTYFNLDKHTHLVDSLPAEPELNRVRRVDPPTPPGKLADRDDGKGDQDDLSPPAEHWRGVSFTPIRQGIASGVVGGRVATDPLPYRRVLATFNDKGTILRRTDGRDANGARIDSASNPLYRARRGTSIKKEDVTYNEVWATAATDDHLEGIRLFDELKRRGQTLGWRWASYSHMRAEPYLRPMMNDTLNRLVGDGYFPDWPFHDMDHHGESTREQCASMMNRLSTLQRRVNRAATAVAGNGDSAQVRRMGNGLIIELSRLRDGLILELGKVRENDGFSVTPGGT